jgi:membrane fusion protein (multidrug efflux system)
VSVFKQILITLFLLLGLAGGAMLYFQHQSDSSESAVARKKRAVGVELVAAKLGPVRDRVEAVGSTLARQAINVVALVPGRIVEIAFEPGQQVRAGDILVRLDADAERAALDETAAALQEVKRALERSRKLKRSGNATQATIDKLEAGALAAQARLAIMKSRLADRTVRAPFDGVVGLQRVHLGARIDAETVLTTLDDLSQIEIDFSISEIHFNRIRIGQAVMATTTVFKDRSFQGRVGVIDTRIQEVSRAFHVRAILPNPGGTLPAGMFMHVSVLISEEQAVQIPEEAVITEGDKTFVFTIDNGRAKRRDVTLGHRNDGRVAVLKGLADGEAVVRTGHQRLRDGSMVRTGGAGGKSQKKARNNAKGSGS